MADDVLRRDVFLFYGFAHLDTKLECLFGCRSIFL